MSPYSLCSFHYRGRGLLGENRQLSKSQRNHVHACHVNSALNFLCPHTLRPTVFRRQPKHGMDFVCFCNTQFTLGSSLSRHYKSCAIAKDQVLRASMRQNTNDAAAAHEEEEEEEEKASMSDHSGLSTTSLGSPSPPTLPKQEEEEEEEEEEQQVQPSLVEQQQQAFIRSFMETTTTQHCELLKTLTEQYMQFLQSMLRSSGEEQQQHLMEMHSQLLRSLGGQFREMAQISEMQSNVVLQAASEQQHA
ncbi:hypothetical protein EDD21DRAFT_216122 [Dissophora ornata]|nr:hypothetical protein EDD21DRAFT_216122 [Dissophora ornata]